jgi:hypothetical protein
MANPIRYGFARDLAVALDRLDPEGGWTTRRRAGVGEMLAAVYNLRTTGPRLSHTTTSATELLAAVANVMAGRSDLTPANTPKAELQAMVGEGLRTRRRSDR